jgi:hypothetical protein
LHLIKWLDDDQRSFGTEGNDAVTLRRTEGNDAVTLRRTEGNDAVTLAKKILSRFAKASPLR